MLKRIKFNQSDINVLLFKIKPFGVLVARSVVISLRRLSIETTTILQLGCQMALTLLFEVNCMFKRVIIVKTMIILSNTLRKFLIRIPNIRNSVL